MQMAVIGVAAVLVIAAVAVVLLQDSGGDADPGIEVVDATGRTVTVKSYQRIASASAPAAAIVCGLGLSSNIVAASEDMGTYEEAPKIIGMPDDDYPAAIASGLKDGTIVSMGAMYNMAAESIVQKGIDPDLVLFTEFGFKEETGDRLTELGITYIVLFNEDTIDNIYKNIRMVGDITETGDKAEEMVSNIKGVITKISDWCSNIVTTEMGGEKFDIAVMMTTTYAVGEGYISGTYPPTISARNAFDGLGKYAEVTKEALAEKNPDVIIYTSLGMGDGVTDPAEYIAGLANDPILKNVNAVANNRVFAVSGQASNAMNLANQGVVYAYAMFAMFAYGQYLDFDIPATLDSSNYVELCSDFWEVVNA